MKISPKISWDRERKSAREERQRGERRLSAREEKKTKTEHRERASKQREKKSVWGAKEAEE